MSTPEIMTWKAEWLEQEAGEVVRAVGAWVVCFRKPREKADLVRNVLLSRGRDGRADRGGNWVGCYTESTKHDPRGSEHSYEL